MDSISAFMKGQANRGRPMMVFDWHKAARLIAKRKPTSVSAGLASDWDWTGGTIYANGVPVNQEDTYTYLASTWATPEIEIDGEVMDCFVMQDASPGWDSDTYWPESAREILALPAEAPLLQIVSQEKAA